MYFSPRLRNLFKSFLYSVWLPTSVLVVALVRFLLITDVNADTSIFALVHLVGLFVFAWPCGLFLTVALQKIFRRSKVIAISTAILFAPLSVWAATIGGLFGPVGIAVYTAVISLPAWLALGILCLIQRKKVQ